jgi:hypothetical protein
MMTEPDRGHPWCPKVPCQPITNHQETKLLQAQDQRHQFLIQIILGGDSPESSSYHALTTNACQSHFLFPLRRNKDLAIHTASIDGCTPADTLISQLVILKSICGLYTPCVSTACFRMQCVRQAHFRKCHSFWCVAPINSPYQILDGSHHGWELLALVIAPPSPAM